MGTLDLFTLIIRRDMETRYERFLRSEGVTTLVSFPCLGTATPSVMSALGLESAEKTLMIAFLDSRKGKHIMDLCVKHMGIEVAGSGIAFLVPMDSVGGKRSLDILMTNQRFNLSEVDSMDKSAYPYTLLVAIATSGQTETVMDAAREAGARGGTVVHAKGTLGNMTRKFLGVSIAEEKELILILTSRKEKDTLMRAIMDKAGLDSEAHTVLFSLPVDAIAGLRSIQPAEEQTEQEA